MAIRLIVPLLTEPGYPFFKHFFSQAGAVLVGESLHQFGLEPVCGPSWFILAIALLHLMRYIPVHGLFLSFLSIAGAWSLHHFQIVIPGPLDAAVMAYPFFYIGSLLRRFDLQKISFVKLIVLLMLSLLLTWLMNRYNGAVDINSLNYGRNMAVYYLCSVTGTMTVLTFCMLLERMEWKWLDSFADVMAAGTIVIVGFHRFFLAAAEQIMSMTPIQGLLFGIGVFIVFYPICILCEKKVPVFTGYRK